LDQTPGRHPDCDKGWGYRRGDIAPPGLYLAQVMSTLDMSAINHASTWVTVSA
jgi:hypothetical protein